MQERIVGKIFVEYLLLRRWPACTKAPAHGQFVGKIGKAVIAQEEHVVGVFNCGPEPVAGRPHVRHRVI